MTTSVNRYVTERAELLARLVLTRRKDLRVVTFDDRADLGIDMLARMLKPVAGMDIYPHFGVEIMGTSEPLGDEQAATRYANRNWKHRPKGFLLFPIIVFLFTVEGDIGYYSWLMEPHVSEEKGPGLARLSPLHMAKIGKRSVDEIVSRVEAWFEAMGAVLITHVRAM
jgi:hypothetical protein